MKYDKTKEKNWNYWQNLFDGHSNYMLGAPEPENEYYIIRDKILSYLEKGDSLLDVGCASGGTYHHLKNYTKGKEIRYKGTDYCEKFIEANLKKYPEVKWEVMDARELKEKDKSYDVTVLYDSIDGLTGWEQALDEAVRVARKRVIVVMWCDGNMNAKKEYLKNKGYKIEQFEINNERCHYHYFIAVEVKNG